MRFVRFAFGLIACAGFVTGCSKAEEPVEVGTVTIEESATDESAPAVTPAAAEFKVGSPAPTFASLEGTDDKKHSLDEFKDAKAIAIVFTCNKCPVAVMYEDRLVDFQKDYADKGVQVVAINVNNAEADKLPAMKTRAEEKAFTFPYLYDPSQQSARDYGAKVTPHVFLLDGSRKLVYAGPVDDNPEEAQVTEKYLRDATDAVLAGTPVKTTDVEPVGCGIQYE